MDALVLLQTIAFSRELAIASMPLRLRIFTRSMLLMMPAQTIQDELDALAFVYNVLPVQTRTSKSKWGSAASVCCTRALPEGAWCLQELEGLRQQLRIDPWHCLLPAA